MNFIIMKSNYSYMVLESPNQQTTFCLTRLQMSLQITKGKMCKGKKTAQLVNYYVEFQY